MNRLVPLAAHSDVGSDCVLAQTVPSSCSCRKCMAAITLASVPPQGILAANSSIIATCTCSACRCVATGAQNASVRHPSARADISLRNNRGGVRELFEDQANARRADNGTVCDNAHGLPARGDGAGSSSSPDRAKSVIPKEQAHSRTPRPTSSPN